MKLIFTVSLFCLVEGYLNNGLLSISITRHHKGDSFIAKGEKCYKDLCVTLTAGTAVPTGNGDCECKCTPNRPVFRNDLNICVDDIQECSLVPFASNSVLKKIPYVFLPLKGQIVYPSADVVISDVESPVCVVSGGQYLGQSGWLNLRNDTSAETPFRLFRDEDKTYLQWVGESSLRMAMEGRIILVHLMCKGASATEEPNIFTPCIAFRVAGNPSVKEMMFITDVHLKEERGGGLSVRDYIAIGVCSLLLAIVYVAAVFLYLHIRRRKRKNVKNKIDDEAQLTLGEEGVVKSNPLLQANRHFQTGGQDNAGYISESNSCCSENEPTSDLLCLDDEDLLGPQNLQTSAIIHPCDWDYGETSINQDASNIEKLPEENVSIIETPEGKDEHPETIKAMGCGNGRRKLYFNPSYFEPDLLKAPPPAAMEFLIKIREVIAIAKHKMSAKKFSPSLLGIPEEEGSSKTEYSTVLSSTEKRETKSSVIEKSSDGNFHFSPSDFFCPADTKQKIIRKWLEDVPVMMLQSLESKPQETAVKDTKILNKSKLWQINEEISVKNKIPPKQEKRKTKGKAPPVPQPKTEAKVEKQEQAKTSSVPPRPPPMPTFKPNTDEIPRVQGKDFVPPAVAKNLMDAVIQELTNYKKNNFNSKLKELPGKINEVTKENEPPSQENHELTEERKPEQEQPDDHEYEIILLNGDPPPNPANEGKDLKIYNLPELLSKSDKTEGYSLVSEVYVNDGYSCCSEESPPSSYASVESDKVLYDTPNENLGRLTIHVSDSTDRHKASASESDNFEPDTLDRKPKRTRLVKKVNEENERYSNQKFQDMECYINSNNSENFTDSLERPSIMLKSNGTFKRNSTGKDIDDLIRNFSWSKFESVGSLREIYEAKSKNQRRTETRSLISMNVCNDHDRHSTLSWNEERRHKLLHRGIVLHINEGDGRKHKRSAKCGTHAVSPPKVPSRPPKPSPSPRSRSISPRSPPVRSNCTSPTPVLPISPRSVSPPLPPPRSIPPSPTRSTTISPPPRSTFPPNPLPRSTSTSPVPRKGCPSPTSHSPNNTLRNFTTPPTCSSPTQLNSFSSLSPNLPPPPRPPKTINAVCVLPPRNTKPPLPPKSTKRHPKPGKFAGRPLPPLPRSKDYSSSSPVSYRDPETLSTHSGASIDSLNSSDYEAFYTLPYEDEDELGNKSFTKKSRHAISKPMSISPASGRRTSNQRSRDSERRSCRGRAVPHRPEDSGYLSTDSDSCCAQLVFPSHVSKIPESGSQNSETEESVWDGASESGGESIATDSFFYGNFKKKSVKTSESGSDIQPYSLRLSDVEVNSDTERHCIPIMVRP